MQSPFFNFFVKFFYIAAILYIYLFVIFDILKLNPENDGDLSISTFFPHVIAFIIWSIIYIITNKYPNNYTWIKKPIGFTFFIFLLLIIFGPLFLILGSYFFDIIYGESTFSLKNIVYIFQLTSFGLLSLLPFLHFLLYKYTFRNPFFFIASVIIFCGMAITTYPATNYIEAKKSNNPCATKRLILNHYTSPYERQEKYNGVICINKKRNYSSHTFEWIPLKYSDTKSFEYLGAKYSRDKNHIFYEGKIIKADQNTFTVGAKERTRHGFAWIEGGTPYKRDKYNIYYKGIKLPVSNVSTFRINNLCHSYRCATADTTLFKDGQIVASLNPKKIKSLNSCEYSKDTTHVYHSTNIITGADPKTFYINENQYCYAYDKNHVYYKGTLLEDADPKKFKRIKNSDRGYNYTDGNNIYYKEEKLTIDITAYEYLGHGTIKDAHTVYYRGKKIIDADPETFLMGLTNSANMCARDKNNYYFDGTIYKHSGCSY